MKQKILSISGDILFECDVPDGLESGLAMRHAIEKAVGADANLARANLAGAYLARANLEGANLAGAYLADAYIVGAKWTHGIVIHRVPLQLHGLSWSVTILDEHMQIGCELHPIADWAAFDEERICKMDRQALRFWRAHKTALLALAESDGRGKGKESA